VDPGQASFQDAVTVAQQLHPVLEDAGAQAFVKTSGKTGLHVLVPWREKGGYAEARGWATQIAERLAKMTRDPLAPLLH
jgi:bifunctional non-homologous end joining protein LigD